MMTNSLVSYGNLRPAFIGSLAVVFGFLLEMAKKGDSPLTLHPVEDLIEYSDSGIWGDESSDPLSDFRVIRVSDFKGDFRLDLQRAPLRAIPESQKDKFRLSSGDILVVKSSGSAKQVVSGRVAVFDQTDGGSFAASNFLLRLHPKKDYDPHYLAYALGSPPIREQIANLVKTMTYPNLPYKLYRGLLVPVVPLQDQRQIASFFGAYFERKRLPELPSYLDEQLRIVSRIEELAAKVEEARILRAHAAEETHALLVKALKSEFEPYGDQTVRIGEVFKVTTGGTPSRGNPAFWDGKVKWVSSGEVAFRPILDTAEKITEIGVAESNAKVYPPNTVLIAMIGQGKTRGQCAILSCDAATNQNVAGIHVYATPHNPEYVYWWLFSRYQESRSSEIGTAQPALSGERVKQMPIPLPPPNEQAQIVSRLKVISRNIEALKKSQAETAVELDALVPSILSRAFRGEL